MDAILNLFEAGDKTSSYMKRSSTFMKAIKELESAFDGNRLEAHRSVITILRLEMDMIGFPGLAPRLYKAALTCLKESRTKGCTTIFDHDDIVSKLGSENSHLESSFKGNTPDDFKTTTIGDVKHWRAGAVPGFKEANYDHYISTSKPVAQINMVSFADEPAFKRTTLTSVTTVDHTERGN
ncbi:unnamed protein product [Ambrosiozyma monospora]|uniref:Unnamed protein product n=1 Tax=Ambrosiozyma monospora TaxID=43982 RepID=A0A9W7DHJ2_AMBMO|nr:unnamed protein product [Ambrosiozyma monospora]